MSLSRSMMPMSVAHGRWYHAPLLARPGRDLLCYRVVPDVSRATERSEGCLEGVTTLLLVTVATSTTQLKPKATEKRREEYTIYSPPSSILYCIADYVKLLTNSAIMQISTGASINGVVLRGLSCI